MTQSQQIRQIVEEAIELQKEFYDKQFALRLKLTELFNSGPRTPQTEIVRKLIDMFAFPE